MKYDTPEFYRYGMPVTPFASFVSNFNEGQMQALQRKKMQEEIDTSALARQQSQQMFPLKMEQAETDIAKIKDDMTLTPYEKQIKIAQAKKDLAEAGKANEETKFIPLEYAIKGTQTLNTGSRFGNAYQYAKLLQTMSPEDREAEISRNPEGFQTLLQTLGNKAALQDQTPQSTALANQMKKFFPQDKEDLVITPDKYNDVANAVKNQGGKVTQPGADNSKSNAPTFKTPEDRLSALNNAIGTAEKTMGPDGVELFKPHVDEARLTAQNTANNKSITAQMRGRRDSAIALESWLDKNRDTYANRISNALNYTSAAGKGQLFVDATKGFMGQDVPQGYVDYKWTREVFRPELVNQIKMMEKMGATDEQREEAHGMLKAIDSISLNPKDAKKLFNQSVSSFMDLSDAVFDASEPYYKGITRKINKLERTKGDYLNVSSDKKTLSLDQWLDKARKINPGTSDEELTAYYNKEYGK